MYVTKTEHGLKNIKSLYFSTESRPGSEYFPCIYIEVDIDFNDIRTGYKGRIKLVRALKIYDSHPVLGWSEEMVLDSNVDRIQETPPATARLRPLPEFVDVEFINALKIRYIEYLMRTWKKILYRNSQLDIYSGAEESMEEFLIRCRELLFERMREELNKLRVVFNRMREQLKEKYLGIGEPEPESDSFLLEVSERDIYLRYADRIAALFMNAASSPVNTEADAFAVPVPRLGKDSELEERLIALETEARRKIALLRENYEIKAEFIDEYAMRPNLKNIHCERISILWKAE